jgi:bacillithiol biosynthesis cysteine-adding enzyme BshC
MDIDCISYQKSGYFSKLIVEYLDENPALQSLYHRSPKLENFLLQLEEKQQYFPFEKREVLVNSLQKQYSSTKTSEFTKSNIQLLKSDKTFTITTGHQLNLFSGPLYFLYKIITTINLCKELKANYPNYNFVPIYWMATEDHDFEEINHFVFKGKKISWNKETSGPVGRLSTNGLDKVFEVFEKELGIGKNADYLKNLFQKTYLEHDNLTNATRFFANELFQNEGLVILDGDDINLKKIFAPYVERELMEQVSFQKVNETAKLLASYNIQVNPREINLFYTQDNLRERIVFENNFYFVNNTELRFTKDEILEELENHPERFSPNVILRPLYQEVILPNLCYIGGGGEIAYWLELKSNFEANAVLFPILLVRNSVLLTTKKQIEKAQKLNLKMADLFQKRDELLNNKTKEISNFDIDFSAQKEFLKQQFEKLYSIAEQTDISFKNAVKAQEIKQIKGLDNLEKRLLKAEKRKLAEKLRRMKQIQDELFPNQGLQERKNNFSEFYLEFGNELIIKLFKELDPLKNQFSIITL